MVSLVMSISDPRDRLFYPHHSPMIDTYDTTLISVDLAHYEIFMLKFAMFGKVVIKSFLLQHGVFSFYFVSYTVKF